LRGEEIRKPLVLFSELCLTAAALIGLYMVYQTWFTNEVAEVQAKSISNELDVVLPKTSTTSSLSVEPEVVKLVSTPLESIGRIYIPRLKDDVWATPIIVGVGERALASGVGFYPGAALPGGLGNFSVAAHRATHGEPFARFEQLQAGDLVYVETTSGWFTYELLENKKISDSATWVLDAKPEGIDLQSDQIITLTTCDPRWNSVRRWAWWGVLVDSSPEAPTAVGGSNDL
jgi:sortase A